MHQKVKSNHKILTRIRYFSYSIPLACIMALLIGLVYGICFVLPADSANQAFAATISPGASLTIANPSRSTTVAPGEIGYLSTNITYSATDTTSYTLRATYANGYSGLSSGSKTVAGVTNGTSGSNMASSNTDAWGFAWGNTSDNDANLQYYTMPAYGKTGTGMANGVVDSGTTRTAVTKKIVFAAKFANNNANTGTYRTNVLLSLVATPKATYNYTLNYDANSGTGAPSTQTANSQDTTTYNFTISGTKPTRTNYVFLGWADSSTATTAQYSAGGTITLNSSSSVKTIYAVWAPSWSAMTTFQQMTPEACAAISTGNSKTLTDSRDNNSYTAAKLSDGKCWMTQNLRLYGRTISADQSDTNANYTVPSSTAPANWLSLSDNSQMVYYGGNTTHGGYYTWCAATAGSCVSSGEAQYSICPKGWRLPTANEVGTLASKKESWTGSGWNIGGAYWPAAGRIYETQDYGANIWVVGKGGYYWTRTANNRSPYILYMDSGYVNKDTNSSLIYYGYAIRCIAK